MYQRIRQLTLSMMILTVIMFAIWGLRNLTQDILLHQDALSSLLPTWQGLTIAWDSYRQEILNSYLPNTLRVTLIGLALSIVLGLTLATLMNQFRWLRWILYPMMVITQTIPTFAIAVLLILIFGFNDGPKIIVVILFCFFPIATNTLDGLLNVDTTYIDLLDSMGASQREIWWYVRFPATLPQFFSGIRIAATYSVVGAVIGEYVGSGEGLGKFLQRSYRSFEIEQVFLAIFLIALVSLVLVFIVSLTEIITLRWRYIRSWSRFSWL